MGCFLLVARPMFGHAGLAVKNADGRFKERPCRSASDGERDPLPDRAPHAIPMTFLATMLSISAWA
jgi:hypothetical protein